MHLKIVKMCKVYVIYILPLKKLTDREKAEVLILDEVQELHLNVCFYLFQKGLCIQLGFKSLEHLLEISPSKLPDKYVIIH